jgi:hypothetical protein
MRPGSGPHPKLEYVSRAEIYLLPVNLRQCISVVSCLKKKNINGFGNIFLPI